VTLLFEALFILLQDLVNEAEIGLQPGAAWWLLTAIAGR
jgi:hypothetical protein